MKTTEQKAKKYDEALEWMRKLYPGLHGATKEDAEHYFPELRENEDENIRQGIVETIKQCSDILGSKNQKRMLDWLEKQKEQPQEDLVYRLNGLMQEYIKEGEDDAEKEHRLKCYQLFWDALEDADFFEQKEQKPVEPSDDELRRHQDELYDFKVFATKQAKEHHISFVHDFEWNNFCAELLSYFAEQKPVDEQFPPLEGLDAIKAKYYDDGFKNGFDEGVESVKPAEWSEEDETRLTNTLIMLKEYVIHHYSKDDVDKSVDWLENRVKFLRPQSKDEIYKEKNEAFKLGKHQLAIKFMNYLDENRPEEKMSLSNGECEDIDKAFKENDWAKIIQYAKKYLIQSEQQPSVWSDEDEKKRSLLIDILKVNHPNGYFKVNPANTLNMEAIHVEELINWLKSLHERFNLQSKAEWSEDIVRRGIKEVGLTQHQIDWLESNVFPPKEEQKPEAKLTGWVARDREFDSYYGTGLIIFKGKPIRTGDCWSEAIAAQLPWELFPDIKWEDEPMEVEIIITKK